MENNMINKILEQQEIIKGMQQNEDSAIKVMKMYEDYKLRIDKAIEKLKEHKHDLDYEPWSEYKVSGKILFELAIILKGSDE